MDADAVAAVLRVCVCLVAATVKVVTIWNAIFVARDVSSSRGTRSTQGHRRGKV